MSAPTKLSEAQRRVLEALRAAGDAVGWWDLCPAMPNASRHRTVRALRRRGFVAGGPGDGVRITDLGLAALSTPDTPTSRAD